MLHGFPPLQKETIRADVSDSTRLRRFRFSALAVRLRHFLIDRLRFCDEGLREGEIFELYETFPSSVEVMP